MSKIKLALNVVEDLRQLADSIEVLANTIQSNEAGPIETIVEKQKEITLEELRAVLAEKSQAGKQPEVKALITKYGANKLTDVDPTRYKEMLLEAEVL